MRKTMKIIAVILVFTMIFSAVALAKPKKDEPKGKGNILRYQFKEKNTFREREQEDFGSLLEETMDEELLEEDEDIEEDVDQEAVEEVEGETGEEADEDTDDAEGEESEGLLRQEEQLRMRLQQNPDDAKALRKLAIVQKNLGKYDEALESAKALLECEGEQTKAMIILAQTYRLLGNIEEAKAYLETVLETYPDAKVRAYMSILLEEEGELDEAVENMEEVVEEEPETLEYYENLGRMYQKANKHGVKVFVEGKKPQFDVPPVIKDGRTLIPVRAIVNTMGASVDWDPETETVTIVKDDITITLQVGSNVVNVNGEETTIDVPATIIDGRTMVPGRFVSEAFNALVHWIGEYEMVIIDLPDDESEEEAVQDDEAAL